MQFKKLFKLLVVSGAMMGAGSTGCAARAADADKGSAKKGAADAGTATDAGTKADTGGGAQGW